MNYNQFSNLSCYEEFEMQCTLAGISKIGALKRIGHRKHNHYFFISEDGIFNWFDLEGNHVEDPNLLKVLKEEYVPKNITKCILPDSIKYIDDEAFYDCESLTSITIPDNATSIGNGVFFGCKSLTSIAIPKSVTNIGNAAFCKCESLTSISIPYNVKHIGHDLFFFCQSLTSITIPDSVESIDYSAFSFCTALTSITIPDSVTNIGFRIFFNCNSLKEVIFKGKTLKRVKQMKNYPFGITDKSIIKCEV